MANGFGLEFDNLAGARTWNPRLDEVPAHGGRSVIGFALPSSTAVDQLYARADRSGLWQPARAARRILGRALRDPDRSGPQPGWPHGSDRSAAGLYAGGLTAAAEDGGGRLLHHRHHVVGRAIAAGEHVEAFKAAQDKEEIHKIVDRLAVSRRRVP